MKRIQGVIDPKLSLNEGLVRFLEIERKLIESVPAGSVVVPLSVITPGATAVRMPSGCRLLIQHDIQYDLTTARVQLQYEEGASVEPAEAPVTEANSV